YEAVEEPLGRRVAVNTIRPSQTTRANLLLRFDRGRRTLARVPHTNIVPVFATGREGYLLHFAKPYLPGAARGQVIKTTRSHESAGPALASPPSQRRLKDDHARSQSVPEPPPNGMVAEPTAPEAETACSPTKPPHAKRTPVSQLLSHGYIRTAVQVMAAVAQ